MRAVILRSVVVALGALLASGVGGCQMNEATGRRQLVLMPLEQEVSLGAQAMAELTSQYGGEVPETVASGYLDEIGQTLYPLTEAYNPELPWEFTLLDSDVINAFALPGGKVFVSRGLAVRLGDEAQLAGVVGHEIGHVTARHGNERISQSMIAQFGIEIVSAWAGGAESNWVSEGVPMVVGYGGQGYLLKFGRDQELEADSLGMRYMASAGYDPAALLDVMTVLQQASGGGNTPEILSTHPHPESRVEQVNAELAST